ncbi:hypothetical protein OXX80_012259 [Metschnikowia pulcherrima]
MSHTRIASNFELLSRSCSLLQASHHALAQNKLDLAKTDALLACNIINKLLADPGELSQNLFPAFAQYALNYYTELIAKGALAISAQEKFCWLTSTVSASGGFWYPTLKFGDFASTDIAPLEVTDSNITLPNFGLDSAVEFRSSDTMIVDSFRKLTIEDPPEKSEKDSCLLDLYQDVLPDCSLVSSLISISELGSALQLRSLVTIFDNETAKVRLFINGAWREVGITTKLPMFKDNTQRSLFVQSFSDSALLWPALIEKAYVTTFKEHYSFGGSNMANDTYMLTGWLPEILLMSQVDERSLAKLLEEKSSGNAMVGLGTGPITPSAEEALGLISNHDYVLSRSNGNSMYELTNPWLHRHSQDGKFKRSRIIDRTLFRQFKYVYINWKPRHKHETKTFFVHPPSQWPVNYLGDKPQFTFRNTSDRIQNVIILVEQFQDSQNEFCVSLWSGARTTIYTPDEFHCVSGGKFVNASHCLIRVNLDPKKDYLVSVVAKHKNTVKFALSIHHDVEDFCVVKAKSVYTFMHPVIRGMWGPATSGGNWTNETFICNPQYDLTVNATTKFMIVFACEQEGLDVNVHLLHCSPEDRGMRLRSFDRSRLIFTEKYTRQLSHRLIESLDSGHYKVIVSTYNRGDFSKFKLLLAYSEKGALEVTQTFQSLGTFVQNTVLEWKTSNRKKLTIATSHDMTDVTFHMCSGKTDAQQTSNYRPAMRASVFDALTREPIIINSKWSDSIYGVFLDCCLPFSDRSYILLIERFETGEGFCRVAAGSSHQISLREYADS